MIRAIRATQVVAAGFLSLGANAWGADAETLTLHSGARIGIIDLMTTDITHFHTGRGVNNTFMRTYTMRWPLTEQVEQPLTSAIQSAGFVAVPTPATDALRKEREAWFLTTTRANKLNKACAQELTRIATDAKLNAILVVAPGFNDSPQAVEGNRLRQLPEYVQGWGITTQEDASGGLNPVLFNLTQMLLVEVTPEGAKLRYREWGGAYVYDWTSFTPPANLRTLPDTELEKLRPLVSDVLTRQTTRLLTHLARASGSP